MPTLATTAVFPSGETASPKGCLPVGIEATIFFDFKLNLTNLKFPRSNTNNSSESGIKAKSLVKLPVNFC